MKEQLISLLESFGYPVFLQGSLEKDAAYPESFFTFWNNETPDASHYNDDTIGYIWYFTVNFYSSDPALVNTALVNAIALLKSNRWIISGVGYDVPSDEPTHTGRGVDVIFIQYLRGQQ